MMLYSLSKSHVYDHDHYHIVKLEFGFLRPLTQALVGYALRHPLNPHWTMARGGITKSTLNPLKTVASYILRTSRDPSWTVALAEALPKAPFYPHRTGARLSFLGKSSFPLDFMDRSSRL